MISGRWKGKSTNEHMNLGVKSTKTREAHKSENGREEIASLALSRVETYGCVLVREGGGPAASLAEGEGAQWKKNYREDRTGRRGRRIPVVVRIGATWRGDTFGPSSFPRYH